MNYPKISIVTTSFNQGDFLEQTILSVIEQGYPNLEYIIIDGGSTDNSVEIIKKYEKHLAFWVSEKDNGMYEGIQKGFNKATGDIMAWINSDDLYHKRAFFSAAEIFTKYPEIDWLQGLPSVVDESGRIVLVKGFRKWSKYNFYLGDYKHIQQESTFWRKSLWEKAGSSLDTSMKFAGDFELWLRFFDYARLYCMHGLLGAFRLRSSNQKSQEGKSGYEEEAELALGKRIEKLSAEEKKNIEFLKKYKRTYARYPILRTRHLPKYRSIFDYPGEIDFDRISQSFFLR